MKRFAAVVFGLLLACGLPAASVAERKANLEEEMQQTMRGILAATRQPNEVAPLLSVRGAQFLGYRETKVSFVRTAEGVQPVRTAVTTIGPDLVATVSESLRKEPHPMAGEKADLTVTMWLYEWRNRDGTYTEQAIISGHWSDTEYPWMDDPRDVIDIRWVVGDLVYLSSSPFDGVQRDQHTHGIASFTVSDQVESWDLFVNFRPVSPDVHGKWTNLFVNYTHTWWGIKLSVTLGAGPTGSTGSLQVNTDGRTWTEGTGLAFQIGSGETSGPVSTGTPQPDGSGDGSERTGALPR
jgi:hypothetical protein